ncbi:hypothetical protein WJX79_005133 [Trebouxia sp. C0005]
MSALSDADAESLHDVDGSEGLHDDSEVEDDDDNDEDDLLEYAAEERSSQSAEDESECDLDEARDASEAEIAALKRAGGRRHALPTVLLLDSDDDSQPLRGRRLDRFKTRDGDELAAVEEMFGQPRGPLARWLSQKIILDHITRLFLKHLLQKRDSEGKLLYEERICNMCIDQKQSLQVNLKDTVADPSLKDVCQWVHACPRVVIPALDQAAKEAVLQHYTMYADTHSKIFVRCEAVDSLVSISDLRCSHNNTLVRFSLEPFAQAADRPSKPKRCPHCQSRGPFELDQCHTVFEDSQIIRAQENSSNVQAAHQARQIAVILQDDLVNSVKPGENVIITGIPGYMYKRGPDLQSLQFYRSVEAVHIAHTQDTSSFFFLTEADKAEMQRLATSPDIVEKIVKSIAPSIYGHPLIKKGIAATLFGGQPKKVDGKHSIRGDIHMLLMGDPGTAKSQFLKYAQTLTPRNVYATGQGASSVGLTACVQRDNVTKEWTLQGGAMVVADQGVCLIDEFDKMSDQDRKGIHEPMEQQTVSVSKAGIKAVMRARCTVLAAANPVGGRYDPSRTLMENVNLTDPIVSRFDMVAIVLDKPDPVADKKLADHVADVHIRSHPDYPQGAENSQQHDLNIMPQEMLRKYIAYAKETVHPTLRDEDSGKIQTAYVMARAAAEKSNAVPFVPRSLDAMIRIAEASARMRLREYVDEKDCDMGISLVLESFVSCQNVKTQKMLRRQFARFLHPGQEYNALILHKLQEASSRHELRLPRIEPLGAMFMNCSELQAEVEELGVTVEAEFYRSRDFVASRFAWEEREARITWSKGLTR